MKYIEVIGYGNARKHIIPLNKIVNFNFEETHTNISLSNGKTINIIENESTIKEMLSYHQANLVNENDIRTFYEGMEAFRSESEPPYYEEDEELPF